ESCEYRELHIGEKRLVDAGVDEVVIGLALQRMRERLCEEGVNLLGKTEADAKAYRQCQQRPDDTLSQLDQMIQERRLCRFDRRFLFRRAIDHGGGGSMPGEIGRADASCGTSSSASGNGGGIGRVDAASTGIAGSRSVCSIPASGRSSLSA